MNYKSQIACDPGILLGKPIIKGTRISVELILKKLSEGMAIHELLEAYPTITQENVMAVLSYSADVIAREEFIAS